MQEDFAIVGRTIEGYRQDVIEKMSRMIGLMAVSPVSGGKGEAERAGFLEDMLQSFGFGVERYDYNDETGTVRPNLVTRFGDADSTIWFVGHMDTVSEGDRSLWKTDPFTAAVRGDLVYGRGAEDNGSGVMASIYALRALKESGIRLRYNFGLALVSDEELGSRFGMAKLIHEGIFDSKDMFVVPDWCTKDGSMIEIGEKGMLWLKITVTGVQVHASTPDEGKNAYRYAIMFLSELDRMLHSKYASRNKIFSPDVSTFEMTKHEKNVDSVNIIPGTDISYMDCRILPEYKVDDVLRDVIELSKSGEFDGVQIKIEEFNREDPAPATDPDSEIVKLVAFAIEELRGIKPGTVGIGGGTVAAFTRKAGMQTAVWGTGGEMAHQPNEYVDIKDVLSDAKVFARIVV